MTDDKSAAPVASPAGVVLVLDDEELFRQALARAIKRQGYEVISLPSAELGLKYLEDSAAAARVDCAVVDMKMEGMDGIEFIGILSQSFPEIVPVMITAYSSIDSAVSSVKSGAFDYISKPFSPDMISYALQKAMVRRRLLVQNRQLREESERSLKIISLEKTKLHSVVQSIANPLLIINRQQEIVLFNNRFANLYQGNLALFKDLKYLADHHSSSAAATAAAAEIKAREALDGDANRDNNSANSTPNLASALLNLIDQLEADPEITQLQQEILLGTKTHLATMARLVMDGRTEGYSVVFGDITDLKELEKTKNRFVSLVAHEIKAPLSAVLGYIHLVRDGYVTDQEKIVEMMERCRERTEALVTLVTDLLHISRHEGKRMDLKIKPLDLAAKAASILQFFEKEAGAKNLAVTCSFPQKAMVLADDGALEIIINNLVSNAIKYTPADGKIEVIISTTPPDSTSGPAGPAAAAVAAAAAKPAVYLTVSDSGFGIKQADQSRIFSEFFRCKYRETNTISGTGLGLSVAKKFAVDLGGDLFFSSVYGEGSKFTLKLMPAGD